MQTYVHTITIEFPNQETAFAHELFRLLHPVAHTSSNGITFQKSDNAYTPDISLTVSDTDTCRAVFTLSNSKTLTTNIVNMTGLEKESPHTITHYTLEHVAKVLKTMPITILDHIGFNLPWLAGGIHPLIVFLQTNLKNKCLYHTFPTGEPWDFILPGTPEEVANEAVIDYTVTRKPKFEIVSFDKSSTPLIQIDVAVDATYADIQKHFPKALHVDDLKQSWVYVKNPLQVDICLVLNEQSDKDWSNIFALSRLQ